ncbi:hypothetical protein D6789_00175 [Candidatus Woesearchaeota archaeon]|nr:MAG: hypothetical protein D6789_00175 [Candidatus Woesearchaeota archaeon]
MYPTIEGETLALTATNKGLGEEPEGTSCVLQRQRTRSYKGKYYTKTCLVVPRHFIQQLGWEQVDELDWAVANGELKLRREGDE